MRAGDRVGVAVSGGADSVALLRLLLDLRTELGLVLSVVHFNHKIRGCEADADERFVAELAEAHRLDFHRSAADTPAYGDKQRLSLEAAGRELRYRYFGELLVAGTLTSVATAHTLDDQAETVLLRVMRGSGTRGLAGIYPQLPFANFQSPEQQGRIVRPLLKVRRKHLREYLATLGQPWREDASNLDVKHTRNRLRHGLLPIIEREFNPSIAQVLADMAEVARDEEKFWQAEVGRLLGHSEPAAALQRSVLLQQPTAMQRRLVRAAAERAGLRLAFAHLEEILEVVRGLQLLETKEVGLPEGWVVAVSARELRFARRSLLEPEGAGYEYRLTVPGELHIPEVATRLRAVVLPAEQAVSRGYRLNPRRLAPELLVRNWRPGDRFWPAYSRAPRKLKELLLRKRIPQPQRALWPVVVSAGDIVWVRGFGAAADVLADEQTGTVVVIEEVTAAG